MIGESLDLRYYFFRQQFKASLEQFYITIFNVHKSVSLCFFILYYTNWSTKSTFGY